MPTTGLLALLDDIATMSKIAARKTIGISGDDLAVNSEAIIGVDRKREWPIVWEVAKGSLRNKAILIPAALTMSMIAPWAITPALMAGGLYLCFEGIEKILHKAHETNFVGPLPKKPKETPEALEKRKIRSAIQTDMILSGEIVVVALGTVAAAPLLTQAIVLGGIGLAMTAGIYGLVGGILKLDDLGILMAKTPGKNFVSAGIRAAGRGLVNSVPHVMKGLSIVGTAAMFMVGGGLLIDGIPHAAAAVKTLAHMVPALPGLVGAAEVAIATVVGVAAGLLATPVAAALAKPMHRLSALARKLTGALRKPKPQTKAPDAMPTATPAPERVMTPPAAPLPNPLPDVSLRDALNRATEKPGVKPAAPQLPPPESLAKKPPQAPGPSA